MFLTPDSWICISLMCFFPLCLFSLIFVFFCFFYPPSSSSLFSLSPFLSCGSRLSCRLAQKNKKGLLSVLKGKLFVSNGERKASRRDFSAIVVIRDFGEARNPHRYLLLTPSLSLSGVWGLCNGLHLGLGGRSGVCGRWRGQGIESLGCIGRPSGPGPSHRSVDTPLLSQADSRQQQLRPTGLNCSWPEKEQQQHWSSKNSGDKSLWAIVFGASSFLRQQLSYKMPVLRTAHNESLTFVELKDPRFPPYFCDDP